MSQTGKVPETLRNFRESLHGALICPGDENYDSARAVWNGMIDRQPALIIRCADAADVSKAVQFARHEHMPVAVRGGGHSVGGLAICDGGMVIDLSPMKGLQVDPVMSTGRAEAGLTLGEFTRGTQEFGLATTTGIVSTTGLAGLTLGGGIGWLMGKYGLTVDNLLSVDLVTAEGKLLKASASEESDLFWAVRGGGGNFGIVTSFEFQLHPVGQVLAGMVMHPMERAQEVLRFYREYSSAAPDELTAYAAMVTTPDGHPSIGIALCYCGSLAEGERVIEPVRELVTACRARGVPVVWTRHGTHGLEDGGPFMELRPVLRELEAEGVDHAPPGDHPGRVCELRTQRHWRRSRTGNNGSVGRWASGCCA